MRKSLKFIMIFFICFSLSSKVFALSVPADGQWHEFTRSQIDGSTPIDNCRIDSGNATAVWDDSKHVCKIKSNSVSTSNSEFTLGYHRINCAYGACGWQSTKVTLTGSTGSGSGGGSEGGTGGGSYKDPGKEKEEDNTWQKTVEKPCSNERIIGTFKLIGIGITIVKILVPLIIIIYGMWDLFNIVVSSDNDAIKKSVSKFVKRLLIGALVFFAPTVLLGLFNLIGSSWTDISSKYQTCVNCMLDTSKCPKIDITESEG